MIILPGIDNSGPEHWQTHWEISDDRFVRFAPSSWVEPDLRDWLGALDRCVAAQSEPPVLVAHSLSCLLVADYLALYARAIAGAFLVAVPDPKGPAFPKAAASFTNISQAPFRCPAMVIASIDDPYAQIDYSERMAQHWGAEFVNIGALGHINDLRDWPEGMSLLQRFIRKL